MSCFPDDSGVQFSFDVRGLDDARVSPAFFMCWNLAFGFYVHSVAERYRGGADLGGDREFSYPSGETGFSFSLAGRG